jgi:hypothetical protein
MGDIIVLEFIVSHDGKNWIARNDVYSGHHCCE